MEFMWLYSLCQCILFVSAIVVSVKLCVLAKSGHNLADVKKGATPPSGSVSRCLQLCLGWVGAIGGAMGIPVNVFLNLRTPQCLYTCIALVCCPMLVRQFTMCLLMLLTLDRHLQRRLAGRYSALVTRRRCLGVLLLCWVASVLASFAQFIDSDVLDAWGRTGQDEGTAGLGLDGNLTTSVPHHTPPSKHNHDREVIGKYLPYGGFLSKFYMEDMRNYTYAEIHSSHWGVCAYDTVLTPHFLVYVHGMTVFVLPFLCLLAVYLDLLCNRPKGTSPFGQADPLKQDPRGVRALVLSLSLLVLLCLPLHIIHALLLFAPSANVPVWAHAMAVFLFHSYGLVPQLLFTPPRKQADEPRARPFSLPHLEPATGGKFVPRALLCEVVQAAAPWATAKHSLKARVCPGV